MRRGGGVGVSAAIVTAVATAVHGEVFLFKQAVERREDVRWFIKKSEN